MHRLLSEVVAFCRGLLQRMFGRPTGAAGRPAEAGPSAEVAEAPGGWEEAAVDPLEPFPHGELRSAESRHSLFLRFINTTADPIRLFWVGYDGHPVRYKTIEAGRSHRQQSFLSHPWTAMALTPPLQRLVLNGQPAIYPLADADAPTALVDQAADAGADEPNEVMTVAIARPPPVAWCAAAHASFPAPFRAAARELLLVHARLARCARTGSPGGETTLGALPVALRDVILGLAAPHQPRYQLVRMPRPATPEGGGSG